jgi:hypothetical protein
MAVRPGTSMKISAFRGRGVRALDHRLPWPAERRKAVLSHRDGRRKNRPDCHCTAWSGGGPRRAGKSTELAGLCGYKGWKGLIGRTRSPPSFGAQRTRLRRTREHGASGAASCAMRRPANPIPSAWTSLSAGRAASTSARFGFPGAWDEMLRRARPGSRLVALPS